MATLVTRTPTLAPDWRLLTKSNYFSEVISSAVGVVARWSAPLLAVAAVAGVGLSVDPAPRADNPAIRLVDDSNPLAGRPFYADPISKARAAAAQADPPSPELTAIANTPQAAVNWPA